MDFLWNAIWKSKIPRLIKHFIWRACRNLIPTKVNLAKRRILEDIACPLCGARKTLIHILWACPATCDVWGEGDNPLRKWALTVVDFWDFWKQIVRRTTMHNRDLYAIIYRLL